MRRIIKKQTTSEHRGCLRRYSGGSQPLVRLVCFPWCGAGASVYRRLALQLPQHIELLAVQLPGREERFGENRLLRMEQVIAHVIDDLISVFDRPLVLFGHSLGALIAYEMALALRAKVGREPQGLILSGHGSPSSPEPGSQSLHIASEEDLIVAIRRLGGTPPEIIENIELMRALFPLLRADYEVLETYTHQPQPLLSSRLIACAGEDDLEVSRESMEAWQQYTSEPAKVHWFNGGHFYLSLQPEILAKYLQEWIASFGISGDSSSPA
ncbi:MAG: alpha/beta fold hydrolase [Pseudomonadota bacterium]